MDSQYSNGEGIIKSYSKATEWFRKAAEKGNVEAQCNMGALYENGYGSPRTTCRRWNGILRQQIKVIRWRRRVFAFF